MRNKPTLASLFLAVRQIRYYFATLVLLIFSASSIGMLDIRLPDFTFAQPFLESVGKKDDIPLGAVTALKQGQKGFIWIGTQEGILRYDGYKFQQFKHQVGNINSLGGNYVFSLFIDQDNRVWAGTASDGVSRYQPELNQFIHFTHDPQNSDSITRGSVFAITQTSPETFWIGTSEGLNEINLDTNQVIRYLSQSGTKEAVEDSLTGSSSLSKHTPNITTLLNNRIRSFLAVNDELLYIGSSGGLQIMSLANRAFLPLSPALEQLRGKEIRQLKQDNYGNIWIATREAGLYRFEPDNDVLAHIQGKGKFSGINSAWVYDLLIDDLGDIWLATIGNGVYLVSADNNSPVQNFRSTPAIKNSLRINNVSALLQDTSGLLWIGTWGEGLQRTNRKNQAFINVKHNPDEPMSPSGNTAIAIKELHNGNIALGTNGVGIEVMDKKLGIITRIKPQESPWQELKDGYITSLLETEPNILWVGTLQNGIYVLDLNSNSIRARYSTESGLPSNRVRTMHRSRSGEIWVGGAQGVVRWVPQEERFYQLRTPEGEIYKSISPQILSDHLDRIWIGSFDGLFVKLPGENGLFRVGDQPYEQFGLLSQNIKGLYQDSKLRIWVDTDIGLHLMQEWLGDQVLFDDISKQIGHPGLYFGANILEDNTGRLWTQWHVIEQDLSRLSTINESDGVDVGSVTIGAHEKLADGRFLFGGTDGLLVVMPDKYQEWDYDPNLVTTALSINGQEQSLQRLQDGLVLSPDEKRFSIGFAALDFSNPQSIKYHYRLRGFESHWNSIDASIRQASYSNLWPGEYTLQIQGSNRTGVMSENQANIQVKVLPAFWQTWYFVFLVLMLLVAFIGVFIHYRTKRLQHIAVKLEAKVVEKTMDLAQANQQLQKSNHLLSDKNHELEETFKSLRIAHEHLEEAQDKLIMQEKMASLGVLTSGVAHELNTPLGIAITAASSLKENTDNFVIRVQQGRVKKQNLDNYMLNASTSSDLVLNNLSRAGRLVNLFKQISLDRTTSAQHAIIRLSPIVDGVFAEYKQQAEQQQIKLINQLNPEHQLFSVTGVLEEVLEGLLSNCFVHAFDQQQAGELQIYAEKSQEAIRLIVADNGKGMSEEQISHAFEPFYTSKRGSECTGLGLHIIYNLVTGALNGEITIASTQGQGTQFIITLPQDLGI